MGSETSTEAGLLEVIRELQQTNARLEAALAQALARIAELEAELARRGGPPKTPANSSLPPSKGFKRAPPAERTGAKPGPPVGHRGTSRRRAEPDHVVEYQPEHCAGCGRSLAQASLHRVGVSQVVELPPVQPRVIEARRYAATCAHCGVTTTASYPPGLESTRVFGPQLEAVVAYLHEEHHVGYARVQAVAHDLFGLALSPGAIANILARTAARLAPAVAAIREQVRASPVIGSDETSARVRGQTWWQWVFQAPTASYHVIVPRRNGAVVETFLGDVPVLVWVSDLWKPQLGARAVYHQVCLAHQLRDLQYVIDAEHSAWAAAFQALLTVAIHLAHERDAGRCTGEQYAAGVAMVEAWCTALLATPVPGAEAARLWVRYRAHRDHLFVFLAHPAVPPTNNASERAVRNSVIHRKVTGGFRSEWGAEAHAAVMTVLQTARKQGRAVLATLQDALGAPFPALPGSLVQQVSSYLFEMVDGIKCVHKDVRSSTDEIDLVFQNDHTEHALIKLMAPNLLVQCRNTKEPVAAVEMKSFKEALESRGVPYGVYVSIAGFTGFKQRGPAAQDCKQVVRDARMKLHRILLIDQDDLEGIVGGKSLVDILWHKQNWLQTF